MPARAPALLARISALSVCVAITARPLAAQTQPDAARSVGPASLSARPASAQRRRLVSRWPAAWRTTTTRFRPVEPEVGDSPGVYGDGRIQPLDLRLPSNFDAVYRITRETPTGEVRALFSRQDGAVKAVFPRSVYVNTPWGRLPAIPPGTVFQLDTSPAGATPPGDAAPARRSGHAVDLRAPSEALDSVPPGAVVTPAARGGDAPDPLTWHDSFARAERLRVLLGVAATPPPIPANAVR